MRNLLEIEKEIADLGDNFDNVVMQKLIQERKQHRDALTKWFIEEVLDQNSDVNLDLS